MCLRCRDRSGVPRIFIELRHFLHVLVDHGLDLGLGRFQLRLDIYISQRDTLLHRGVHLVGSRVDRR